MKIGVITDCFRLPLRESVRLAARLGFDGVQMYATHGEMDPDALTPARREEIRDLLAETGLAVSALCGDMGGYGFQIEKDNPARVAKTKRIVDLAAYLGAPVVTTHIGVIPADPAHPRYRVMQEAMRECGTYAAGRGVSFAIETGPESAPVLYGFLQDLPRSVGVNLDPANFVMVTGQDPVQAVRLLGDRIVHTHAKDGVMLKKTDPAVIYDHFAGGGIEALNVADYFLETPLGEGGVDFDAYYAALREIGYDGFLTVERETGSDPVGDITAALSFLRRLTES